MATRREFLTLAGVGLVGLGAGVLPTRRARAGGRGLDLDALRRSQGEGFVILGPEGRRLPATLVAVEDGAPCERVDNLSLAFGWDGAAELPEGLYALEHADGSRLSLFLQPSRDGGARSHLSRLRA
jgi:hypothetical protein